MMKTYNSILLVDDDADDTSLFRNVLEEIAPSVTFRAAVNGTDALNILNADNSLPDLIFLDLNMPLMNGKECLAALKQDDRYYQIPVIMYTTSSLSRDIEETMLLGAVCFIVKPSSIKEMKHIISSLVNSTNHSLAANLTALSENTTTFIVC